MAIVASSWHEDLHCALLDGARKAPPGVSVTTVVQRSDSGVAQRNWLHNHDAVVALGVVIRGRSTTFRLRVRCGNELAEGIAGFLDADRQRCADHQPGERWIGRGATDVGRDKALATVAALATALTWRAARHS